MQLRTFSASSMAEALVQVKREMGGDAVILHTRTYHRRRWLGLRRVEVVEITAGNGLNVARGSRSRQRPNAAVAQAPLRPLSSLSSRISGGGMLHSLAAFPDSTLPARRHSARTIIPD